MDDNLGVVVRRYIDILTIIASEASLLHELAGAFLWYIYIQDRKNILKMNKEVGLLMQKKELIQVE